MPKAEITYRAVDKAATLDNQSVIKAIGDTVDYIKKNYKRKWGK